jgi:glycosyltransferase involved in cell wall biosynthesis
MPYGHGVRIAHVSDCYLPRTGGIETQVRSLALRQQEAGLDVRVITATPGPSAPGIPQTQGSLTDPASLDVGVVVHRCAMTTPSGRPLPFELPIHLRTRAAVTTVLQRDPVDVVHVHAGVISPFAWGALRAAHRLRIPALVTVHSIWGPLARPGFRASDALVGWSRWGMQLSAVSELAAERVQAAVPGAGEVLVIGNGIDADSWRVEHATGPPGDLRLVAVMRLAPRKRLMPLIRIVQQAQSRVDPGTCLRLVIIGDGPERARAERAAHPPGLVQFTGRLDQAGIRAHLAQADLYVQPSVKESFGIAALEARAAGVPVLARTQAGTAQFIRDGVEGLLVSSDRAMADTIAQVAVDRSLLDRIRAHNSMVPPEQTWTRVLASAADGYARAIERVGRS